MEEKSRMARSRRPRSRHRESGPPRRRKLKAAPASLVACEPHDRLPDSPAQPTGAQATPLAIREPPQPNEAPRVAPNPPAGAQPAPPTATYPANIDVEALTRNVARLIEEGGRAVAAYLKPREDGTTKIGYADEVADAVKTIGQVAEYWYTDPQRSVEMQTRLGKSLLDLVAGASQRFAGEPTGPV